MGPRCPIPGTLVQRSPVFLFPWSHMDAPTSRAVMVVTDLEIYSTSTPL